MEHQAIGIVHLFKHGVFLGGMYGVLSGEYAHAPAEPFGSEHRRRSASALTFEIDVYARLRCSTLHYGA